MLVQKIQQVYLSFLCELFRKACVVHFLLLPPLPDLPVITFSISSQPQVLQQNYLYRIFTLGIFLTYYSWASESGGFVFWKQHRKSTTGLCPLFRPHPPTLGLLLWRTVKAASGLGVTSPGFAFCCCSLGLVLSFTQRQRWYQATQLFRNVLLDIWRWKYFLLIC